MTVPASLPAPTSTGSSPVDDGTAAGMLLADWLTQSCPATFVAAPEVSGLVQSGVPVKAVRAYREASAAAIIADSGDGSEWNVAITANAWMRDWLWHLAAQHPDMRLSEAAGWVVMLGYASPRYAAGGPVLARVGDWVAAGLGADALLYAAAGFAPEEARAGLDTGSVTEADARALAALRGVPLPF